MYQMCVLMQTEDQLLKSLESCAAVVVSICGMKASSGYRGLGYLTRAEWNAGHNEMLQGLMCNSFAFTILNHLLENNFRTRHALTDLSQS